MTLDAKQKKFLLIGFGVAVVAYLLLKKSKDKSEPKVTEKPCKKWVQPKCVTTPCPPICEEY
jgi:hypothetical protein